MWIFHVYWDKLNYQNHWNYCIFQMDTCNLSHIEGWCQILGPKNEITWADISVSFQYPRSCYSDFKKVLYRSTPCPKLHNCGASEKCNIVKVLVAYCQSGIVSKHRHIPVVDIEFKSTICSSKRAWISQALEKR